MIPKIRSLKPLENYILHVIFDDGKNVLYDVKEDMNQISKYKDLQNNYGLFQQVKLDKSRTCIYWNDTIDLPSDIIYEYGIKTNQ